MPKLYFDYIPSPVGSFLIAGTDSALHFTGFTTGHQQREPANHWTQDSAPLAYAIPQFQAYFDGDPIAFDVPIAPRGTVFQHSVWDALRQIPFGRTASYGEIAKVVHRPNASRAVGAANRANHLPIIIPCHRIIGSNGSLTGFGGGMDTKRRLLEHEKALGVRAQLTLL